MVKGMSNEMLRLEQVSKIYSSNGVISTGFNKVSLSFSCGEFIAITGESGSGKSTLLNVISGIDSYEEGEMYILGQPTSGYNANEFEEYRKEYIGNIFQSFNLISSYTVYQNVELVLLMSGYDKDQIKDKVIEIIDKVGLRGYEKTKASKLSGGQKQRVAIARALAKDTPIIVADEPTGNLDVKSAGEIIKILHDISKDKLVIIVTHNYEQVEPYVTRKIQMHDGRVVEDKQLANACKEDDKQLTNASKEDAGSSNLADKIKKAKADPLTKKSMLMLSFRNAFNIPSKFMLLLMVFVFLWSGVVASYTSSENMLHVVEKQGYNRFFSDISEERYILRKNDRSKFTEKDYSKLQKMSNIDKIVKEDLLLDSTLVINDGNLSEEKNDIYVNVNLDSLSNLDCQIADGKMAKRELEAIFVIEDKENSYLEEIAHSMINKEILLREENSGKKITKNNLTITGTGYTKESINSKNGRWIDGVLYLSDKVLSQINSAIVEQNCSQVLKFNDKEMQVGGSMGEMDSSYGLSISEKVDEGKLYIPEEIGMYTKSKVGNDVTLENKSIYFTEDTDFKIGAYYNQDNCEYYLGEKDYDQIAGMIYMNPKDYEKLFEIDNYQSSVFVKDLKLKKVTEEKLAKAGYDFLNMADAKTSFAANTVISKILYTFSMVMTIVVLFLICYFIVKLILKSRNSYFGIARMLGATRKNCNSMLRVELFTVYNIAFLIGLAFVLIVKGGLVKIDMLVALVGILTPMNLLCLYVVMGIMAILLANRYARKMFKDSAMNAYREEV